MTVQTHRPLCQPCVDSQIAFLSDSSKKGHTLHSCPEPLFSEDDLHAICLSEEAWVPVTDRREVGRWRGNSLTYGSCAYLSHELVTETWNKRRKAKCYWCKAKILGDMHGDVIESCPNGLGRGSPSQRGSGLRGRESLVGLGPLQSQAWPQWDVASPFDVLPQTQVLMIFAASAHSCKQLDGK